MDEDKVQMFVDTMQVKSKTERADVVWMIKKYFGHVAKAHEKAAACCEDSTTPDR